MKNLLSIITPFYCSNRDEYIYERSKFYIQNTPRIPGIERVIIDQGSPRSISEEIRSLCLENDFNYFNLDKGHLSFSIGLCRNFGVQISSAEFISFSDIDLFADIEFYKRVLKKISNPDVAFNHLEVIPCFYLTEEASRKYVDKQIGLDEIYEAYLGGDSGVIAMAAPASSCMIARKSYYLASGGVSEEFFGHGYEDFELMNRMAIKARIFHRSHDYYSHDFSYSSEEYKGYRTFFAMHGRRNLAEKLFYVHLYHTTVNSPVYKKRNKDNKKIFERLLKDFDAKKYNPASLPDLSLNYKTLVVGFKESLGFKAIREVLPKFGKITYRSENTFNDSGDFLDFINANEFDFCLFSNPYGNEHRLELYKVAKENKLKVFCYDRGALPGSWFFDENGFNASSSSYSPSNWDVSLDEDKIGRSEKYLHELCSSDNALEKNGDRIGGVALRKSINPLDKKVLFVPLQRPGDSVIKYFSGAVSGVDDFARQISTFAQATKDWIVVVKKHPLEDSTPEMPGCVILDPQTHVNDILEMCDAVALINSGVGLLSLCFRKPVFNFGEAFYSHDGLSKKVDDWNHLSECLRGPISVNYDAVVKFIYYLVFEFYSFATSSYREVQDLNARRTEVVDLEFLKINIPGVFSEEVNRRTMPYSTLSPYYEFHRAYFSKVKNQGSATLVPIQKTVAAEKKVVKADPVIKPPSDLASSSKVLKNSSDNSAESKAGNGVKTNEVKIVPPVSDLVINPKSKFRRKLNKFVNNPKLFLVDALNKK